MGPGWLAIRFRSWTTSKLRISRWGHLKRRSCRRSETSNHNSKTRNSSIKRSKRSTKKNWSRWWKNTPNLRLKSRIWKWTKGNKMSRCRRNLKRNRNKKANRKFNKLLKPSINLFYKHSTWGSSSLKKMPYNFKIFAATCWLLSRLTRV